jgi:hypothetical protein
MGDQFAHRRRAARREQFEKLRGVVPPSRGAAGVVLALPGHKAGGLRPVQGVKVWRQRRAERNLDARAPRKADLFGADDAGGAIALGTERHSVVAGGDDEAALGGEDGASDDSQTIPESATGWKPQELARLHRPRDAEQLRDLLPRDSGPVILDVMAVGDGTDTDVRILVETVVRQLFQDQAAQLAARNAGALLQPLDSAEKRPVLPLEL